uniref:Uncharacterized protein n=1 Tax=Timema genevievae TaxID=629358 RepID=A0A7R9JYC1_TIMGE|nr:unnamed protein product [Timema genevievae]
MAGSLPILSPLPLHKLKTERQQVITFTVPSVQIFGYCVDDTENGVAVQALTRRLEEELRAAKTRHLECGEVLLPADLLPMIARDVFRMAESEPCGLRGCTLYLNYETDQLCRKIGRVECDPGRVSTFELFLTLRHDSSSWYTLLPQFLKNWTSGRTIVLGHGFTLEKKKLYRSYRDLRPCAHEPRASSLQLRHVTLIRMMEFTCDARSSVKLASKRSGDASAQRSFTADRGCLIRTLWRPVEWNPGLTGVRPRHRWFTYIIYSTAGALLALAPYYREDKDRHLLATLRLSNSRLMGRFNCTFQRRHGRGLNYFAVLKAWYLV